MPTIPEVLLVWDYHTGDIEDVLERTWLHCRECGYEAWIQDNNTR